MANKEPIERYIEAQSERYIEAQILNYLRGQKIYCWKNTSAGYFDAKIGRFRKQSSPYAIKGTSDILGIIAVGRCLAIEVKSKYGKVSPEQLAFIKKINENGGLAFVARSLEEVIKCLSENL